MMQKWNNEKGEYEPYEVPANWQCKLYEDDMNQKINIDTDCWVCCR